MGSLFKLLLLYLWLHLMDGGSVFVSSMGMLLVALFLLMERLRWRERTIISYVLRWIGGLLRNVTMEHVAGEELLLNLDLGNPILVNAIKAFSPLKIRMGGTLQDNVIYETKDANIQCAPFVKNSSDLFGFSKGCLSMSRWDQLNVFFKKAGAMVVFGLNALSGRTVGPDGSAIGAWNSSNAKSLIRYTVNKGYTIHGWELGNELCGSGIGAKIIAEQYASDKTPKSLQVVTQHIYNLGPGNDNQLMNKILDPSYQDGGGQPFRDLQAILKNSSTSAVAWVGEAGGAYNSGQNRVSNSFVNSFWYLDQLGMAASYDTKTYCRQTLIGGNYGLLDTATFVPHPDYYSALLWHRLMGSNVLSTSFGGMKNIRAYAHCSKQSRGITLLLINYSANTTIRVRVLTEGSGSSGSLSLQQGGAPRINFARMSANSKMNEKGNREEYHLRPKDGNLQSKNVVINGEIMVLNSSGGIPPMEPFNRSMFRPNCCSFLYCIFSYSKYNTSCL
ncbi:Heparanase-like protein 3 [Hibiscus syriacus]|uniref:Heparanase-like protein 3 n=1 Tax=Hibiscus syriacus TaxID=106335 RepID=A0A6A3A2N0_HIBSY|nr:Heparanase-like protein 3 [Hibiscus syriacus]